MEYTIRTFEPSTGCLGVEYPRFGFKVVRVPLDSEGLYIVGDELAAYLSSYIPAELVAHREAVAQGIANSDQLASLVVPIVSATSEYPTLVPQNISAWAANVILTSNTGTVVYIDTPVTTI